MRQTPVAEHRFVRHPEREADDVDVRQHRADGGPEPEAARQRPSPPLPRRGGRDGMAKDGWHFDEEDTKTLATETRRRGEIVHRICPCERYCYSPALP